MKNSQFIALPATSKTFFFTLAATWFRSLPGAKPIVFLLVSTLSVALALTLLDPAKTLLSKLPPSFQKQSLAAGAAIPSSSKKENPSTGPSPMGNSRQITFEGRRAGEGYFNSDGSKMVFQSEREPGNPFYQIYIMDLLTGKTDRISTGRGATTCAWFHPDGKRLLFSSTHLDPNLKQKEEAEWQERKTPTRRYAWSFDDTFQIYEFNQNSKELKALTKGRGYHAEGAYSPDGQWIVFASNRAGYINPLDAETKARFSKDPSYLMSIYKMRSDGTGLIQLTDGVGYNGGPFFSFDGSKITWRKFSPNGATAEIWTMNSDGTNQRQITRMSAMSWAPFFHPSGDYIIFTTNKLGYNNFELYIVDADGKRDPVRVSYLDDFDGLPVFHPSGHQLSWTHRNDKGESQIWLADWNDQLARQLLGLPAANPSLHLTQNVSTQDLKPWVKWLASPELAGRKTGSSEEKIWANAIAANFLRLGLTSPVEAKDFQQEFQFTSGVSLGDKDSLAIRFGDDAADTMAKIEQDFLPLSFSKTGAFPKAGVAFAGYGIVAPANENNAEYNSYRGLDVSGRWAMVFRDIPEEVPNERRVHLNFFSRIHNKALVARQAGAVGLLVVRGPNSASRHTPMRLRFDGSFAETGIPVLSISDSLAERLLAGSGRSLKAWQDVLDKGEIQNTTLQKVQVAAQVDLRPQTSTGRNILAELRVPGAKSTLVIGAHVDHLGRGDAGSSLARGTEAGGIHLGADDNASGVAAVIGLASELSAQFRAGTFKPKQNILFAIWSGEEIGLLGSTHFVSNSKRHFSANLNLDMVGRLREKLFIQGVGSAKEWPRAFEQIGRQTGVALSLVSDPYLPTDSMAFYLKGWPAIHFFTGAHSEYHTPRDTEDLINYEGVVSTMQVVSATARLITEGTPTRRVAPLRLTYQKVESSQRMLGGPGRSFRVFLGTIPDYAQEGTKGVRISGTSKNSPAEKAGLVDGDIIVQLGSLKIENLYDYVYGLQSLRPLTPVNLRVIRRGSPVELTVTPVAKGE